MTERGRQVVRAHQHRVDAGHCQNLVELLDRLARLDLDAAGHERIGRREIRRRGAAISGRPARRHAAKSGRRVAAPGHGSRSVRRRPHLRDHDAGRARVQGVHDPDGLVRADPIEERNSRGPRRDEHRHEMLRGDRPVLAVGDEQVEARSGEQLGNGRIEDRQPRPEQEVARPQPGAQVWSHRRARRHSRQCTAAAPPSGAARNPRCAWAAHRAVRIGHNRVPGRSPGQPGAARSSPEQPGSPMQTIARSRSSRSSTG